MIETELCKLAYKYGSDKCPKVKHDYTPYYYELFKDMRSSVKGLLEIGIGDKNQWGMRHVPKHYQVGASLRMWRDFFPNAMIYGMDMDPNCMFEDERIKTFLRVQSRYTDLYKVVKQTGPYLDIVIDDGSHYTSDQIFTCKTMMKLLTKKVIYVIEDVLETKQVLKELSMYKTEVIRFGDDHSRDNNLIVVKHEN